MGTDRRSVIYETKPRIFQKADAIKSYWLTVSVWTFDNFDDVVDAVKQISTLYDSSRYNLLYRHNGKYYLIISNNFVKTAYSKQFYFILGEYSSYRCSINSSAFTEGYLNEYGTLITDNAIDTICEFY